MNERDEVGDETERLASDAVRWLSFTGDPEFTLRLKTWTVPLSLETASH